MATIEDSLKAFVRPLSSLAPLWWAKTAILERKVTHFNGFGPQLGMFAEAAGQFSAD
jgi:hypothetical protein